MSAHADAAAWAPSFEDVPAGHRWHGGPLIELWTALERDARILSYRAGWAWFVLPEGALIALRYANDRRELRIAWQDVPGDGWEERVEAVLREFGCEGWERADEDGPGVAVIFLEPPPPPLEVTPKLIASCYIARDPRQPHRAAVWYAPPQGRHRLVAGDFRDRREAHRWMEFHRGNRGSDE